MKKLLFDTHVLIWHYLGSDKLGKKSQKRIETAFQNGVACIPAISFWEIAMLEKRGALKLNIPASSLRKKLINLGINEIFFDGEIGILATEISDFHKDPADRIIMATAIKNSLELITADTQILKWKGKLVRHDARK